MPERVKEQILIIRETGITNMFDLPVVQRLAYERDFFELVIFLEEHVKKVSDTSNLWTGILPFWMGTDEAEQSVLVTLPEKALYSEHPLKLTAEVKIYVNNTLASTQTADRTEQSFTYKANTVGPLTIRITANGVEKALSLTVTESEIDVEAETEGLVLYLSSQGRSNNEEHPDVWTYGDGAKQIAASFIGFNWASDGWQADADENTVLRVSGDARVTVPYKPFASDFRSTGKTIEMEFSTRNVLNYDAVILSCIRSTV